MRRVEDQRAKTERLRAGGGLILIESPYISPTSHSSSRRSRRDSRPFLPFPSAFLRTVRHLDDFGLSKKHFPSRAVDFYDGFRN